jgi:hypothetical protein
MPRELSDLLREATSEAPKARYGVDDVVRAGQRRLKRRQAGWAVAAVVAVAATIGVPQILTPRAAPLPAAPSPSPSPTPWDQAIRAPKLVHTFRGYSAGKFRVADPVVWGLSGESAFITKAGAGESPVGILVTHRPEAERVTIGQDRIVESAPIRGRRAYFIETDPTDRTTVELAWEYADDGSLAIISHLRPELTRADLRRIAEGFTLGDEYPVIAGFRIGYVPDGWKLIQTGVRSMQFTSTKQAVARLTQPDPSTLPPSWTARPDLMTVRLLEPDQEDDRPSARPRCDRNGQDCSFYPERGGPVIHISFSEPVVEAEMVRVLKSVQVRDVLAIEGIPAAARLPGY